jgi:hypothetical protein
MVGSMNRRKNAYPLNMSTGFIQHFFWRIRLYSLAKPFAAVILLGLLLTAGCSTTEQGAITERGIQGLSSKAIDANAWVRDVPIELAKGTIVPDQLMLRLDPSMGEAEVTAFLEKYDLELIGHMPEIGYCNVAIPIGADLASYVETLAADPAVGMVEPVFITHAFDLAISTNDQYFEDQWGLFHINAPQAWVVEPGDPAVTEIPEVSDVLIAILDTGVDYIHDDLSTTMAQDNIKFIEGINLIPNGNPMNDPMDDNGHGTMVAGICAAYTNNIAGIASVGWNPRILAIKILDSEGNGTSADSAQGILYATNQFLNAKNLTDPLDSEGPYFSNPFNARLIINMSYGFESPQPLDSEVQAVQYAVSKGAILVAAAGDYGKPVNDGVTATYPAAHSDVIAVGAIDQANGVLLISNTPSVTEPLDTQAFLVAPGKDILSTFVHGFGDPYAVGTGTSFAAPFVSGTVALIWSQFPFLNIHQVKDLLKNSANADVVGGAGIDATTGWGLVDAYAALKEEFAPYEDDMIVRAFTNPVLHGDIIFIMRTKYELMEPPQVAWYVDDEGFVQLINGGFPIGYNIGFDDDGDGQIDETITTDPNYFPNEVVFGQMDDATYIGRVHLMQDLGKRLGTLIIDIIGVPKHFLDDDTLPREISAQTSIEITDFNYS